MLVDYSAQSMAEYARGFLERYCAGKAINTQRNYRVELGHFLPVLGGVRLQEIKPKHICALEHMQKVASATPQTSAQDGGHATSPN